MGLFGSDPRLRGVPRGMIDNMPMPGPITGFGGGTFNIDGTQATPQAPQMGVPRKRKTNWGGIAADFLAGLAGQPGPYLQMRQHQQKIEEEEARAQRDRAADQATWLNREQWQRDHPQPRVNDTVEDFNWFKGLNPQDRATYQEMHPEYRQGPDGQFYRVQRAPEPPETLPPNFDFGGAAAPGTPPFAVSRSRLDNITMMAESGGNPNAVSTAGARGRMQVMPETARDPGFGVRPSNGTAQDDERVGREYRAAMQRRYGGDPAKMWAAYNWGPGNLDNAISRHGERWLDAAPAETRNYVSRNLRALGGR